MFSLSKAELLDRLSKGVTSFFPELHNHFICPVCLARFEVSDKENISEAHIIPKAAGGRLKTLLCTKCNSSFGSRQDKWFGEMVRLKREGKDILSTKIKKTKIEIDGMRINGRWDASPQGDLRIYVDDKRNPSSLMRKFHKRFETRPHTVNVRFPLPIIEKNNIRLIDAGYLTAAYLLWFAFAGYSWVFQKHLDPVRRQILFPFEDIIPNLGVSYSDHPDSYRLPMPGTIMIDEEFGVGVFFHDALVIFPSADDRKRPVEAALM